MSSTGRKEEFLSGSFACLGTFFICARALLSAGGALLAFRCGRVFPPASRPRLGSTKFVPVEVYVSQGGWGQAVKGLGEEETDGVAAAVASSQMMNAIVTLAGGRCLCRYHSSFGMRLVWSRAVMRVPSFCGLVALGVDPIGWCSPRYRAVL